MKNAGVTEDWAGVAMLVAAATLIATLIGELDAAPSPIAVALLLGLAVSPALSGGEASRLPVLGRFALRTGVVLLGFRITLEDLSDLGLRTVLLAVAASATVLSITVWLMYRLGTARRLGTLLGVGSAICGASAVAAAGTTIEASEEETAYAIATVTLIGTVATFTLLLVGSLIGLDDRDLGVWIGMMVHDVGQVVAASTTVGDDALTSAVPVKLVRVLLLVPVLILLAGTRPARATGSEGHRPPTQRVRDLVPGFVALFLLASAVSSAGAIPDTVADVAADLERILFTAALFAIGASVHLPTLRRIGIRPGAVSAAVWCVMCAATALVLRA